MPNLEGRELGGCKLLRKLGAGGMGEVYLAEQRRLGNRLVAIKVVSPDDASFHPEVADDMARRFQREAALLGQLSHPNILPVHDSGVEQNLLYLVMDYAPEGSLADAIRGVGNLKLTLPIAVPLVLDIVGQIAAALEYTHEHGVVHRDVKPGNVLIRIERDGHWHMLLADYGVARDMEANSARSQISGTFAYMAPEQFSGQFSPASDQYALAVMTFQLLSGRTPFEGDLASLTRAHMYEPPPSLHALNPRLPTALDGVLTRALAKEPAQRYPSVAAFAAALRQAASGAATPTEPATQPVVLAPPPLPPEIADAATQGQAQAGAPIYAAPARQRARSGPRRLVVALLAAVLLLAGVLGSARLLRGQADGGTPTQTAVSSTSTPTITASATIGATPIPTLAGCPPGATQPDASSDMQCLPSPPAGVGKVVLAEASPSCPGGAGSAAGWVKESFVDVACLSDGGGAKITSTAAAGSTNLACLDARGVSTTDGFLMVLVTRGTGSVALGFRESFGDSSGSGNNITGYYIVLSPGNDPAQLIQYELFQLDKQGKSHQVGDSGTFAKPLAPHFALGLQFKGSQFTLYVNGNQVQSFTDSAIGSAGWAGLCTLQGSSTFKNAELFQLAG